MSSGKENKELLILIPARSASTRVKDKNTRVLGDRPLIGHIISSAIKSGSGRVVVSTNSREIAEIANRFGAQTPFMRPQELSASNSASVWVILHALAWFEENEKWSPDIVAFCPPTNPFTGEATISAMLLELKKNPDVNSIVTITSPKTHPFRIVKQGADKKLRIGVASIESKTINDIERSQDWPVVWEGSPSCRMTRTRFFKNLLDKHNDIQAISSKTYDVENCIGFQIDAREAFDIDVESDWEMAQFLWEKQNLR
jgi:N-acylneuraminate cytidylyltransferase/CMP-N,N'-diacetyllegionaminic acid synthase